MNDNSCTWKVVATTAANDFYYNEPWFKDEPECTKCWEDRDWCACDREA